MLHAARPSTDRSFRLEWVQKSRQSAHDVPHVLNRWMLHGSREAFSEVIGGLAFVIPREMSALVHPVLGLSRDRAVDVCYVMTDVQSEYSYCTDTQYLVEMRRACTAFRF
jgi:hypothetical protein